MKTIFDNEIDPLPNDEEFKVVVEAKIEELKKEFASANNKGRVSFNDLQKISDYIHDRFTYVDDNFQYSKADFWDSDAFDKLMYYGKFSGDCDHASYAFTEFLYRVCNVPKDNLWQVSCQTETGQGHLVSWTRAANRVMYQLENRKKKVYSLKYYRELGYEYWDYSSFVKPMEWRQATEFVALEIYKTPSNLKSDRSNFRFRDAVRVDKSKTLGWGWSKLLGGAGININAVLHYLNGMDWKTLAVIGSILLVGGIITIYLRTVTDKAVHQKKGY